MFVWADDIVTVSNERCLYEVKEKLKSQFKMNNLGQVTHFIGIGITQEEGKVKMNQSKYIDKVLKRWNCQNRCQIPERNT